MKTGRLSSPFLHSARFWATCLALATLAPQASAQDGFRSWSTVESPTIVTLTSVAYGNGRWLALGDSVFTSTDGSTWTEVLDHQGLPTSFEIWGRLRFIHDRFVMEGAWRQSLDGKTWTDFPVPADRTTLAVSHADGKWVCVGGSGLFATAETPGNWTINSVGLTSDAIQSLVFLNGTWHAFAHQSIGMRPFSSPDGVNWSIQSIATGQWFANLETGEIRKSDGSIETVAVGTTNTSNLVIVRSSQGSATLESRDRATFGRLVFRRSGKIDDPNGVRREWVNIEYCCGNQKGPQIYTLSTPGETPRIESLNTTNDLFDLAAGPDSMIAVGAGGMIRRYGTQPSELPPVLSADIQNSVEISWQGRTGASYMIQESPDGQTWTNSLPTTLPGRASIMKWNTPVGSNPRRLFRVQEF